MKVIVRDLNIGDLGRIAGLFDHINRVSRIILTHELVVIDNNVVHRAKVVADEHTRRVAPIHCVVFNIDVVETAIDLNAVVVPVCARRIIQIVNVVVFNNGVAALNIDAVFSPVNIVGDERALATDTILALGAIAGTVDFAVLNRCAGYSCPDVNNCKIGTRDLAIDQRHIVGVDMDGAINIETTDHRTGRVDGQIAVIRRERHASLNARIRCVRPGDRINDRCTAVAVTGQIPARQQVVALQGNVRGVGPVGHCERTAVHVARISRVRVGSEAHIGKINRIRSGQSRNLAGEADRVIDLERAGRTRERHRWRTAAINLNGGAISDRDRRCGDRHRRRRFCQGQGGCIITVVQNRVSGHAAAGQIAR